MYVPVHSDTWATFLFFSDVYAQLLLLFFFSFFLLFFLSFVAAGHRDAEFAYTGKYNNLSIFVKRLNFKNPSSLRKKKKKKKKGPQSPGWYFFFFFSFFL